MADDQNKIIFGAEFDGGPVKQGVEELLGSLDKARASQALLKQSIDETTSAMRVNRKEAEALSKQVFVDPKLVDEQSKKIQQLNEDYDQLVSNQTDLKVGYQKVNDITKEYIKTKNEEHRAHDEVNKQLTKATSLHHLAGDAVKKVSFQVKELIFGLATGFAGGAMALVLPALEEWIGSMIGAGKELTQLQKNQKTLTEIMQVAAKAVGDDVAKLDLFKMKLNDTNVPAAKRIEIAKEYNKTADETNKIDLKQIDNLQLINEKIEAQNKLILQRAISTAALGKLTEASTKFVEATLLLEEGLRRTSLTEEKVQQKRAQVASQDIQSMRSVQQSLDGYNTARANSSNKTSVLMNKEEKEVLSLIDTRNLAKEELDKLASLLNPLITPEGLTTHTTTATIENVFSQKLAELKARLASAMAANFQSTGLIKEQFAKQLDKDFQDIAMLLKEKKLTSPQADILKALLKQINDVQLAKGLEDFRKLREDALKKVDDLLLAAQIEAANKRVANLRDEFTREREAITQNYDAAVSAISERQKALFKEIDEETKKGLLSPVLARRKKFLALAVFGDLLDQAEQAKMNAQAELAFKTFQRNLENAKLPFEADLLNLSQETTETIRKETAKFFEGKVTYERYQKNLTEIIKKETRQRREIAVDEAEEQLRLLQLELKDQSLTEVQRAALQKQIQALQSQIAQLRRDALQEGAKNKNDADKERINKIISYVQAVQGLAQSVIGFWQQVNQAESEALDRSIALQNKRVENAQELADKGNAELLESEQKRLDELDRRREANARKQLAVNNALAASQAIVAAISAIAQAVQTGSPFAAIAAVGSVIGAIAAVYQFANSLNTQNPSFFEGEEYVSGPAPAGRDKVKANLHVGERVVRTEDNKQYWDTLSAIHNHLVPPSVLNEFVNSYPGSGVPSVDFDRLSNATNGILGADSFEVLGKLDRLNGTMEQVVVGLSDLGINVSIDEEGFQASISKAARRRSLRNRA